MPDTMEMAEGLAAASAAFASGISGQAASGAPAPAPASPAPEAPAPAPVETAPASSPAAPAAAPAPAAPVTPAPAAEPVPSPASPVADPAAQRYLEMHGGNVEAALKAALTYNNRLAALAKASPELFQSGAPGDPSRPIPESAQPFVDPASIPAPLPPIQAEPDQREVEREVDGYVQSDATATNLIRQFTTNAQVLEQRIVPEIQKLSSEVAYLERRLQDPEIKDDDLARGQIRDTIRTTKLDLTIARSEAQNLRDAQAQLDANFRQYRNQIAQQVYARHQSARAEQAEAQQYQSLESQSFQELTSSWSAAIQRVAATHALPADALADFKADAKTAALAALANPEFVLDPATLDAFLAPHAKRTMERLDRYHRTRSAEYAHLAEQRAATPAPASGPAPAAAPSTTGTVDLESVMQSAAQHWRQAAGRR